MDFASLPTEPDAPRPPLPPQRSPPEIMALCATYLALPPPASSMTPFAFLSAHIASLPSNLGRLYSPIVLPQPRSAIPTIRNRRLRYASASPPALSVAHGRDRHPLLYERVVGSEPPPPVPRSEAATNDDDDEEAWGAQLVLAGEKAKHGKFGAMMKGFEEEREGERLRSRKREEHKVEAAEGEEFDSESDEDEMALEEELAEESVEQRMAAFARLLKERFLDGLEVRRHHACIRAWREVNADWLSCRISTTMRLTLTRPMMRLHRPRAISRKSVGSTMRRNPSSLRSIGRTTWSTIIDACTSRRRESDLAGLGTRLR